MQTVIFCGGKGTRISGSGPKKKELFQIGNRPILWHIMKTFAAFGHKEFVLPLGHRGDLIRRYFLEYAWHARDICFRLGSPDDATCYGENDESDWQLTMVDTDRGDRPGVEVNKGERVKRISSYLTGERFFVTYGDGVGDIDIDALLRFHTSHGKWVTVTGIQPVYNFGVPAQLKSWIDHLARKGETFIYTETGPQGLLKNKRAIVVLSSDGTKMGSEIDFASGYIRHMLGFFGITDVDFVAADAMVFAPEDTLKSAEAQVDALAA